MDKARKTGVSINYNGANMAKKLPPYLEEFRYTDVASGENDAIDITLNNRDFRFMRQNMPKKGDRISAFIHLHNWKGNGTTRTIKCGKFILDDLSFDGSSNTCSIGAVSAPVKGEFKATKRTHIYKNVTLKEIAGKVTNRAGIALFYDAPKVFIKKVEQSQVTDSEFLLELCEEYGLGIKIYNGKIVVFDEEKYEQKKTAFEIKRSQVLEWSWNTTLQRTYSGAKVNYNDPDDNKEHKITIGSKGRMLNVEVNAFSKKEAALKAKAKLASENKKQTTMTVSVPGNVNVYSTQTVQMTGFGKLSGKYYVDRVIHTVGSGGYEKSVELHKVSKRIQIM